MQQFNNKSTNKKIHAAADVQIGTCSCPYFHKHGYCKHLIHVNGLTNTHSDKIMLKHQFKFKGNIRRAQHAQVRPRHAAPALQ